DRLVVRVRVQEHHAPPAQGPRAGLVGRHGISLVGEVGQGGGPERLPRGARTPAGRRGGSPEGGDPRWVTGSGAGPASATALVEVVRPPAHPAGLGRARRRGGRLR